MKRLTVLLATASLAMFAFASLARAEFGVDGNGTFDGQLLNADASATAQAGAHPDSFTTTIEFNWSPDPLFGFFPGPDGNVKTIGVDLPPGLIGNPLSMPKCTSAALAQKACPPSTIVGEILLNHTFTETPYYVAIQNLVPPPGVPARLGFYEGNIGLVTLDASLRSDGDYGITVTSRNTSQAAGLLLIETTFWGVPADPSHDARRCSQGRQGICEGPAGDPETGPNSAGVPEKPFLSLPTSCSGAPLETQLRIDPWQTPGAFREASFFTHQPGDPNDTYSLTGCELLDFDPSIDVQPSTNRADSPTGLEVEVSLPQNDDPDGLATAHLRDAVVTLPQGLVVNPAGANGLDACSPEEIGLDDRAPARCPDASRLGSVEVITPLLEDPMEGAVYQAEQDNNPFGSTLAIYLVAEGPGVRVKLAGKVEPDPRTGRLTTTFADNPQLPFESFKLSFFGGAAAPLRTPGLCGSYSTTSQLTPWSAPASGPPDTPSDSFAISQGAGGGACAGSEAALPHAPDADLGTIDPLAGRYSPFVVRLRRKDGSQRFSSVSLTPPPGLLAKLAGTPYCPESALAAANGRDGTEEQASPSCPAASEVGNVAVAAGAGPAPYWARGKAYLAGPYNGAPLSLAVITPAVAGPFDLGTVVVRTALQLDPRSAQITAVSDPIPAMLEGIPLDVRTVAITIDRPQFTRNPTNCDPLSVSGQLFSTLGVAAPLAERFQVGECGRLGFKPKLGLRLKGGTKRGQNPKLIATLKARAGEAGISRAAVKLPRSAFLDQSHIRTVCTRVQWAADACPRGSVYGKASATTPLLDYPLRGRVYLRSSDNKLPDLVVDLRGPAHQPLRIELVGRTDSVKGALRNTFSLIPDAPVSRFRLELFGGKRGLVVNSRDVCADKQRAVVALRAHNGRAHRSRPVVRNAGCKKQRRAKRKRAGHRRTG